MMFFREKFLEKYSQLLSKNLQPNFHRITGRQTFQVGSVGQDNFLNNLFSFRVVKMTPIKKKHKNINNNNNKKYDVFQRKIFRKIFSVTFQKFAAKFP